MLSKAGGKESLPLVSRPWTGWLCDSLTAGVIDVTERAPYIPDEELFGPLMQVVSGQELSIEALCKRANATRYGLFRWDCVSSDGCAVVKGAHREMGQHSQTAYRPKPTGGRQRGNAPSVAGLSGNFRPGALFTRLDYCESVANSEPGYLTS